MTSRQKSALAAILLAVGSATSAQGAYIVTTTTYTQTFDDLGATGTTTSALDSGAGGTTWYVGTGTGAISSQTVVASNGGSNSGNNYNLGTTSATDRALGSLAASSTQRDTEARFTNGLSGSITSITVSYTGEQWRVGGTGAVNNTLIMQFSTNGTSWVNMGSAFDFNTPVDSGTTAASDGNNATFRVTGIGGIYTPSSPIAVSGNFYLRWADPDDSSSDHAMAIDDLTLTFAVAAGNNYLDTNGSTAGLGIAGGGSTVWNGTTTNWTGLADGTGSPAAWAPAAPTFFAGTSGTVNVDTVAPQAGMEFDSSGYVLNGGAITLTTVASVTVLNGSDTATINSKISGTVGLTKGGAGTLILGSTDNDFSGSVAIAGGTLQIADDKNLGNTSNAIAFTAGGILKTTTSITTGRGFSGAATLDIAPATTLTSTGSFSASSLNLSNTGTLDLKGTTPSVGALTISGAGTLTSSTGVQISTSGGTPITTTHAGIATISSTGGLNLGTGSKTVDVATGGTLEITAPISLGAAAMRKIGGGTLELSGVNTGLFRTQIGTASAGSPVAGGLVKINNKDALGANQLFLNNGTLQATATLTGVNALPIGISIGGITLNGHGTINGSDIEFAGDSGIFGITGQEMALTVNNTTTLKAGFNFTTSGGSPTGFKIDGSGKLIVNSNASTMTLATTISGATAEINGAWGSDISVVSGGKLQGTGIIGGDVTTALGTTLAPGNSIGTLTTGSLEISGGLDAELGAGVSDLIIVNGDLTLNPTATINFLGTADNVTNYTLLTYSGTLTGVFNSPTPPSGYTINYGTGTNSAITLQLVPEPGTLSLMVIGALGLMRRRR